MATRKTDPKSEPKEDFIACADINLNALGGMVHPGDRVSLPAEHPVTKALLSQGKIKPVVKVETTTD